MQEQKYLRLKKRLIFVIAVIFLVLIFAVNFLQYSKTKDELENKIALKNAFVEEVYHNIIQNYKTTMTQRASEIIGDVAINEAFENRDRQALLKMTNPLFEQLQKSIEGLTIMHFHLANGDSFLRLHSLENWGDSLWDIRDMIRKVHLSAKPTHGFEMGKYDQGFLTYRVALPVFSQNGVYLGAFELGVNSQAIIHEIKSIFAKIDATAAFYIEKDKLRHSLTLPEIKSKAPYVLASKDENFIDDEFHGHDDFCNHRIEQELKSFQFIVYEAFIKNFMDESIGVFILQYDITSDIAQFKKYLIALVVISVFLMVVIIYVVNYGFNYYVKQIHKEHERFKKEHERAQLILDAQNNLVLLIDATKPILANKAFLEFFQVPSLEVFAQKYGAIENLFIAKKRHFSIDRGEDWLKKLSDTPLAYRKVAIKKNGEEVIFEIDVSKYEGKENIYVLTFDDITQIMNTQDKLVQKAYKDALTQIYNRRYFEKAIVKILENVRKDTLYAIMLFDIDKFKNVNDTYGHKFGDEVLQYIAKKVQQNLRSEDIFIRWGGEEFIVLLKNSSLDTAVAVAQKLREAIKSQSVGEVYVTCSFGVTQIKIDDDENSLIDRVDKAMYRAKKEGRDRVVGV
jgi:diguanylate cyclase (GGDEF)-like protein